MKLGNCSNKLCWQENEKGFTILGLPFIMDGMGTPSVMKSSSLSSISSSPGSAEVLPPIQQAILNSHQLSDISFVLARRLTEEKEERCRDDDACWLLCRRSSCAARHYRPRVLKSVKLSKKEGIIIISSKIWGSCVARRH
jgi:hypothetical protein